MLHAWDSHAEPLNCKLNVTWTSSIDVMCYCYLLLAIASYCYLSIYLPSYLPIYVYMYIYIFNHHSITPYTTAKTSRSSDVDTSLKVPYAPQPSLSAIRWRVMMATYHWYRLMLWISTAMTWNIPCRKNNTQPPMKYGSTPKGLFSFADPSPDFLMRSFDPNGRFNKMSGNLSSTIKIRAYSKRK